MSGEGRQEDGRRPDSLLQRSASCSGLNGIYHANLGYVSVSRESIKRTISAIYREVRGYGKRNETNLSPNCGSSGGG